MKRALHCYNSALDFGRNCSRKRKGCEKFGGVRRAGGWRFVMLTEWASNSVLETWQELGLTLGIVSLLAVILGYSTSMIMKLNYPVGKNIMNCTVECFFLL